MECEEAKLKTSALIDNEIDEKDVPDMISHLESCYRCRNEYIELLSLQKRMKSQPFPEPPTDCPQGSCVALWVWSGGFSFSLSYALLLAFTLYSYFPSSGEGLFVKLAIGGVSWGVVILFGMTLLDRIREQKTDRYRGIMK